MHPGCKLGPTATGKARLTSVERMIVKAGRRTWYRSVDFYFYARRGSDDVVTRCGW